MHSAKGFVDSTDVIPVPAPPCCSFEIIWNQVNLLTNRDGTDGEDELLGNTSFLAKILHVCRGVLLRTRSLLWISHPDQTCRTRDNT